MIHDSASTPENGGVIANKIDYLNKMKRLISDETKFKKLSQKPTKSRETSLISYLPNLNRDGIIHDAIFPSAEKNRSALPLRPYDSKA